MRLGKFYADEYGRVLRIMTGKAVMNNGEPFDPKWRELDYNPADLVYILQELRIGTTNQALQLGLINSEEFQAINIWLNT